MVSTVVLHQASPADVSPAGRRSVNAAVVAGLVALAVLAAARAWTSTSDGWPTGPILLSVAALVLGGAGFLMAIRGIAKAPPVSAGVVWVTYFVLAFGIASLAWVRQPPLSAAPVTADSVVAGILICFASLLAWSSGYLVQPLGPLTRLLRAAGDWAFVPGRDGLRVKNAALLLYGAGTAVRAVQLATGRFGYFQDASAAITSPSPWQQALSILDGLTQLGLVLAALDAAHGSRTRQAKLVVVGLLVVEAGVGMLSASKQSVLVALLAVASVYLGSLGRVRWRLVALCVVATIFVFAVNAAYRAELRSAPSRRVPVRSVVDAFPRAVQTTFSPDPVRAVQDGLGRAASRIRSVDNVALVIEKTPAQIPYEPWEELLYGPVVGLVPRALWSSKPVLSTGLDFSREYYEIPDTVFTASAITTPGDLYRHGGLATVGVGMFLFGALARSVDQAFSARRDSRRLLVLVPLVVLIAKSEADFVSLVLALVPTTMLALVVARWVFVPRATRRIR